jgi:hypothetical protein
MDKQATLSMVQVLVKDLVCNPSTEPDLFIQALEKLHKIIQRRTVSQDRHKRTVSLTWDEVKDCATSVIEEEAEKAKLREFHVRRYACEMSLCKIRERNEKKKIESGCHESASVQA